MRRRIKKSTRIMEAGRLSILRACARARQYGIPHSCVHATMRIAHQQILHARARKPCPITHFYTKWTITQSCVRTLSISLAIAVEEKIFSPDPGADVEMARLGTGRSPDGFGVFEARHDHFRGARNTTLLLWVARLVAQRTNRIHAICERGSVCMCVCA